MKSPQMMVVYSLAYLKRLKLRYGGQASFFQAVQAAAERKAP
ncbi:MAG: hypothetical protein PVG60_01845 [Desulfarculaceae bacterium]|jgi:hypothetical protein